MSHGKIMLVGIGPGSAEHMTARARAAIVEADTVIGYVTYIKLVADLLDGKEIIRKSMTEELDRAIEALARAREGKKVALISSGDAGVYGMGGPTFEVLMQAGWTPPEVTVETDEAGNTRVSLKADVQLGGKTVSIQGEGTGPVDAFVAGLNATGLAQVRVMDYREHAIGSGANAQAVAYLELRVGDHTLFGVGMDADILTASLKGILSGLARAGV